MKLRWSCLSIFLLVGFFMLPHSAWATYSSTEEAVYTLLQHNIVKLELPAKDLDRSLNDLGMTYATFDGYKHSLKYYYYKEKPEEYYVHVMLNPNEGETRQAVFDRIQKIRSEALAMPGPVLQLEFVNNYLIQHTAYDEAVYQDFLAGKEIEDLSPWSAKGALVDGKAVCEGYAGAFMLICDQLGIPCVKVNGELNGIPHTWNSVFIESIQDWLNVDVTNNDPGEAQVPDNFKTHLFLITDDQLRHYGYKWSPEKSQAIKDIRFPYMIGRQLDFLRKDGIIVGRGGANFASAAPLTREELAAIIVRIAGKDWQKPTNLSPSPDVSDWAQESVQLCRQKGYMIGYPDGSFKGANPVSKRELATIVLRLKQVPANTYTWDSVEQVAVSEGLLSSGRTSGIITPVASRADIFDMLYRLLALKAHA
ncbi:S-layer homology domain-containing protein [Peptococcus simiae]|uniref:S-layer homology domain-containing protein n=1 Tax=Peptococcus simiae TaxID=1643805 RepID=UPI00397FC0F5